MLICTITLRNVNLNEWKINEIQIQVNKEKHKKHMSNIISANNQLKLLRH